MDITYESTSCTAKLKQGVIHYHDIGHGPCILFIHGSGPGVMGWANFQGNLEAFSKHFRCIIIDLPGYGKSDPVSGDPIGVCVEACIALLEHLDIKKTHIIGNSLGGIVGSYIAATQHHLVSSFITIGGIGINIFSTFPSEGLNLLTEFVDNPTIENIKVWLESMVYDKNIITEQLIASRFHQATDPKTLATTKELYSRNAMDNITDFRQGANATKTIEHLSSIQAPTLITWGRDDRVSPMDSCLIPMRLIPNAELHIFPKCGHWAMIERKLEFEALVLSFLQVIR